MAASEYVARTDVSPVETPRQLDAPQFGVGLELVEVDRLVHASEARSRFQVDGSGLTVAVLDTGLNANHVDFDGRVVAQRNLTTDNAGKGDDATDGDGHGTNVGGIIVAGADHVGIAPGAGIAPVKVLPNVGSGSFAAVSDGLQWVLDRESELNISAVCMSLGDSGNYSSDMGFAGDSIQKKIRQLRDRRVAVCVAAGNDYFAHQSQQGMGYPAIFRETVSVGAVYDEDEGSFSYQSGATAFSTAADRITPFSQRLHSSVNADTRTDIFAPGAPVTSSGINGPNGESIQQGTSQATPVIAGVVLLMQEFYLRTTGELPVVTDLVTWIRKSGAAIHDGDDENDNVSHTNLTFRRVDALAALGAVRRHLEVEVLNRGALRSS